VPQDTHGSVLPVLPFPMSKEMKAGPGMKIPCGIGVF
jgi:hypothetical protein